MYTNKIKKTVAVIAIIILTQPMFSQNPTFDQRKTRFIEESKHMLQDASKKAPYIFEGKVIHGQDYYNKAHTGIYTKFTIKVFKVLKGEIADSLIELITIDESQNIPRNSQVNDLRENLDWQFHGVFYGFKTKYELDENFDKSRLYISEFWSLFIPFNHDSLSDFDFIANYGSLNFKTLSEMYEVMGFHHLSLIQLNLEKEREPVEILKKRQQEFLQNRALLKTNKRKFNKKN